jgi:N-acetylglucosamine-6-phosphate deacetylase
LDGTIAGSVSNLMDCLRTAVLEMGIPITTAVACATSHPAKALGIIDDYGTLEAGKYADIVLLDADDLIVRQVIKHGRLL